jgi:hypothetical protein
MVTTDSSHGDDGGEIDGGDGGTWGGRRKEEGREQCKSILVYMKRTWGGG